MHCLPALAHLLHGSPDVGSMIHFTFRPRHESHARGLFASGPFSPLRQSQYKVN
jgi:hypothetical protein